MRCLLRYVNRRGKNEGSHRDKEFNGGQLSIGRATDQDIQLSGLRVGLRHASISVTSGGQFRIQARGNSPVQLNDEMVQSALLQVGDRVRIGHHQLTLLQPSPGYELEIAIEQVHSARGTELQQELLARAQRAVEPPRWFNMRIWSWGLLLGILVMFLVAPLVGFSIPSVNQVLRGMLPFMSDRVWNSGALAKGHQFFGEDCNACHQAAFTSVRNEVCLECHQDQPHHADLKTFEVPALEEGRCASCHKEHNGDQAFATVNQGLCLDCHQDIKDVASKSELRDVDKRFPEGHPQFRATLITHRDGKDQSNRIELNAKKAPKELSNLDFSHKIHLDKQGLLSPEGKAPGGKEVLTCASCHTPEPGGQRMQPVRFEEQCHRCHLLTFDTDNDPATDRDEAKLEVPHGNRLAVLHFLESYYAMRALEGGYPSISAPEVVQRRRRPGKKLTEAERSEALEWARNITQDVGAELFEYRACNLCHTVTMNGPSVKEWAITPVRVARQWFPKARFDHGKHKAVEDNCDQCHKQAHDSKESEDILLGGKEDCEECHAYPETKHALESTCTTCHGFHVSEKHTYSAGGRDGVRGKASTQGP
jgi:predicted CXXCH cytochrome family protein